MKRFDPKNYPYLAASIQAVQYGHAGFVYLSWVGLVTAGLLGLLISFGMALASSKINDIAKKRKPAAWVAFLLLAVISPAFVGVAMWIALDVITLPLWRVVVAALWGLIPDGGVALVGFIVGKGMVAAETKQSEPQSEPKAKGKSAKRIKATVECKFAGAGCGQKFATQNAANAHARGCAYKPTIIDVSEKVTT